jgi:hypothetical protein
MSINKPVYINPTLGLSLPTYVTGQYLTNDGTNLSWAANGMGDLLANGTVPLTANWNIGAFSLTGLNLTAAATLSAEALTNVAGWTTAGNWTHVGTTWSHTTGSATALTATGETAIVVGTKYQITMVLTTSTAGGGLAMQLGGQSFAVVSTGAPTTYTYDVTALDTSALSITPTSGTWVGSLTISVKIKTAATGIVTNEGVTQNSGQYLFPYGNASYPPIAIGSLTYGFYRDGANGICLSMATTKAFRFYASGMNISSSAAQITFGGSGDALITRQAAATLAFGLSAAAPGAQVLKGADSDGTADTPGASMTIGTGKSRGSSTGGSLYLATAPAGGAGTGENALLNRVAVDGTGKASFLGVQSQATNIQQSSVVVTLTNDTHTHATALIPAGALVIGVSCRNLSAVAGDATITGYSIGDGTDIDRWGSNVSPLINETTDLTDCTVTTPAIYAAATDVILTYVGSGTNFTAGGTVRVTVHYISLTAPTT